MAIDTVKLQSPALTAAMIAAVESLLGSKRRVCMDTENGEIENVFTTACLKGSYDANISLRTHYYKRRNEDGI